jgi:hypothetical protein
MRIARSLLTILGATPVIATTSSAQKPPPVHLIDRPIATSKHDFKGLSAIRQLPNGTVLLNDAARRQLLLLDSSLNVLSVVADSTPGSTNSYGPSQGGILTYPGDSTLFVLPRVPSMYMIDPSGKVVRVMAVPRPQEAASMSSSFNGVPGIDAKGRWVYRGQTPPLNRPTVVPGGPPEIMSGVDSAPIVRVDLATHTLDTVAMFKILKLKGKTYPRDGGRTLTMLESDPVPMVDDWAVLSDGSVAIVRGQDYHVDFINQNGSSTRGPKMAYAWEPLNDDAKLALIDSMKKVDAEHRNAAPPPTNVSSTGSGRAGGGNSGGVSAGPPPADLPPTEFPAAADLPDYRPPFTINSAKPDADGHLWIRTTHREASAGSVYDVVSREGKVIDRVQLQPGRSILGFGKGGIVYVSGRDDSGSWVEKSIWRAPTVVPYFTPSHTRELKDDSSAPPASTLAERP